MTTWPQVPLVLILMCPLRPPTLPQADLASVRSDGGKGKPCYDECASQKPSVTPPFMRNNNNNNPPTRTAEEGTTQPET